MNQSMYSAAGAIVAQQQRLDIIGNNLANVNTDSFKNVRADFKDNLYQQLNQVQPAASGNVQRGTGAQLALTLRSFAPGSTRLTQNPLDLALQTPGFFTILDGDTTRYTRDGSFSISVEPTGEGADKVEQRFLVTKSGKYVLDENGNKIQVYGDLNTFGVNDRGEIKYGEGAQTEYNKISELIGGQGGDLPFVKLAISDFINPNGLMVMGENLYDQSISSGAPTIVERPEIRQGSLEASNVDMANEMVRMIRTQRALQFASKALTTADEMDGKVSAMR